MQVEAERGAGRSLPLCHDAQANVLRRLDLISIVTSLHISVDPVYAGACGKVGW